ncbi:hypothetical protein J2R98_000917 [Alkalibacillus filiformis]|uniref:DUF3918 domain-containing protein n=1 Tax=Alkalibacillus filiformis TaxID=200990 RepID=A0ABU0DRZ9_9BACI|nr:hypothetical protein [Alkalibacillus filiformis]MDQ0351114.1 hypothetical protein [Alkalibacillus filiformis]
MSRVISTGVMGAAALYFMRNRNNIRKSGMWKQLRKSGKKLRKRYL